MSIDNATPEQWHQAAYLANLTTTNAAADLTPLDIEGLNRVLDRPFCEVPYVTRAYVLLLYQMGKIWLYDAGGYRVMQCCWSKDGRYRVQLPVTKPSIDWSQIKPKYKWLARDSNGAPHVFAHEPECLVDQWDAHSAFARVDSLVSYALGDCDWKDSLVERPAGV